VVLAPLGVAAVNVEGQTIHSFFHFKPNVTPASMEAREQGSQNNTSARIGADKFRGHGNPGCQGAADNLPFRVEKGSSGI
jgi:hypothetical protein